MAVFAIMEISVKTLTRSHSIKAGKPVNGGPKFSYHV